MKNKWQKLCDASDWFDPNFVKVITEKLKSEPVFHRKQWEFAAIYSALESLNLLNSESVGIAFGAAKERLLYTVANEVKKLTATDLYSEDAHWEGTQTTDPRSYLLEHAPFTIDEKKLDAKYMNMREITFPDNSFDFAYSSCVFEHISSDDFGFIEHLKEVYRTLKPGGCYVLTTELLYEGPTIPVTGSYFFELNHLLDIVSQSGLQIAEEFNGSLMPFNINEPSPFAANFGFNIGHHWMPHLTCVRQGMLFTSCCLVLKKGEKNSYIPPKIIGFKESQEYVTRKYQIILKRLWKDWQPVDIVRGASDKSAIIGHEHFNNQLPRKKNDLAFHTPFFHFGTGETRARISIVGDPLAKMTVKLFSFISYQGNALKIEKVIEISGDKSFFGELEFVADNDRIYAVLGRSAGVFQHIAVSFKKN